MIFGKIYCSPHAIERFKNRIMSHRQLLDEESDEEIIKKIHREIDFRNVMKIVSFGDKYKFVFTKRNTELRFVKSRNGKFWVLVTCVRYPRLIKSEEPISLDDIKGKKYFGIRTAIEIREKQKIDFENKKEEFDMEEI